MNKKIKSEMVGYLIAGFLPILVILNFTLPVVFLGICLNLLSNFDEGSSARYAQETSYLLIFSPLIVLSAAKQYLIKGMVFWWVLLIFYYMVKSRKRHGA